MSLLGRALSPFEWHLAIPKRAQKWHPNARLASLAILWPTTCFAAGFRRTRCLRAPHSSTVEFLGLDCLHAVDDILRINDYTWLKAARFVHLWRSPHTAREILCQRVQYTGWPISIAGRCTSPLGIDHRAGMAKVLKFEILQDVHVRLFFCMTNAHSEPVISDILSCKATRHLPVCPVSSTLTFLSFYPKSIHALATRSASPGQCLPPTSERSARYLACGQYSTFRMPCGSLGSTSQCALSVNAGASRHVHLL